MRNSGVEPDVDSYNSVISALGNDSEWERAFILATEMRERGVRFNLDSWNAEITASGNILLTERSLSILAEMRDAGVEPDMVRMRIAHT
jgi:pentatricopeptide repeat protein